MSSDPIKKSSNKFNVPSDIKDKFDELYKLYKDAASTKKLVELGIYNLDDFTGLFYDDEGVEILLEGLDNEQKQLNFLKTSGIKTYSGGGRNRKRRSKKRRGNRRKSTRRRSRR